MLRLAHFSDVHLTAKPLGWRRRDFASKKVPGWMNVKLLGRGARFKHAPRVVEALRDEIAARGFDHLIFSGDATKLAFENEFANAARRLGVNDVGMPPGIAVPGNHDYYTAEARDRGLFDRYFDPWMRGRRVREHRFPFAQQAGHAWLIAVNSSTANWWTFDASGGIGSEQLERLRELTGTLGPGPRILVTHYPLRTSKRKLERRTHRLRDHAAALETARACGIGLWLHGHIHKPYVLEPCPDIPFPIICAGSCTQTNRWSYNEYSLEENRLHMVRRTYQPLTHRFEESMQRDLTLPLPG